MAEHLLPPLRRDVAVLAWLQSKLTSDGWAGPTEIGLAIGLGYVQASSATVPALRRLIKAGKVEAHPTKRGVYRAVRGTTASNLPVDHEGESSPRKSSEEVAGVQQSGSPETANTEAVASRPAEAPWLASLSDRFEAGYRAGIMAALCQFASDQDVDLSLERLLAAEEDWLAANIRASGTGALQQALAKLESADRRQTA